MIRLINWTFWTILAINHAVAQNGVRGVSPRPMDTTYYILSSGRSEDYLPDRGYQNPILGPALYRLVKPRWPDAQEIDTVVNLEGVNIKYKIIDSTKNQDLQKIKEGRGVEPMISVDLDDSARQAYYGMRLHYYDSLTDSLILLLKQGATLSNICLDVLNLDYLAECNPNKRSFTIDIPLRFHHCIFNNVEWSEDDELNPPGKEEPDSIRFLQPIIFSDCSFFQGLQFSNARFEKKVFFENFYVGCYPGDYKPIQGIAFKHCCFKDSLVLLQEPDLLPTVYQSAKNTSSPIEYIPGVIKDNDYIRLYELRLTNSLCFEPVTIVNASKLLEVDINSTTFRKQVNFTAYGSSFTDGYHPRWRSDFLMFLYAYRIYFGPQNVPENNLFIYDCDFQRTLNFEKADLRMCSLSGCEVRDSLILYGTYIDTSINFPFARLKLQNKAERNIVIVKPETFLFQTFGLATFSVKQAYFPYIDTDTAGDYDQSYPVYNEFYINLEESIAISFSSVPEIKDELTGRFEYQRTKYDRIYDWKKGKIPAFLANSFIEITVNHGYHGERNLLFSSLSLILLFALIYFFRNADDIDKFFEIFTSEPKAPNNPLVQTTFKKWRPRPYINPVEYAEIIRASKCVWVSFYIFITPKFSAKFFKFKGALFLIFLTEWLLGICFILLFLFYIASKYSFVRSLFGL